MNSLESLNSRYRVFITLHEIPPIRDGELNGLTFGVKDVILTERVKTTAGSKILADFVPSESAHIVRAILERGGKILGKTNTHEFAVGATNTSSIIGPCANPLDPERICGGSSGGSAAAVALSLVDVGIGTDTGGSVRIPAALCGVVGFKPTTGLISTEGIIPFSWTLDTIGFLTRDVETMKRVTRSLIPAETQTRGSRRPKIGVVLFGEDRVSKEVLKALYGISSQLDLIEVSFGDLESRIRSARRVIAVSEGATYHAKWLSERPNDYFRDVREVLESGLKVTSTQYISSVKEATYAKNRFREMIKDLDALASPTVTITAPKISEVIGREFEYREKLITNTEIFNLLGVPSISIKAGHLNGLPIGLMLSGKWGEDLSLLELAKEVEETI